LGFTRTIAAGIHGAEMVFHGGLGLESRERAVVWVTMQRWCFTVQRLGHDARWNRLRTEVPMGFRLGTAGGSEREG